MFGEKLFKLRKEKGLSQEDLAEKLNTTRQAISKWENNQGFPETEKLLMIGNIFEVSIDYLLKEAVDNKEDNGYGYYVSREMSEGFLLSTRKNAKHMGLGFGLFALAFEPYLLFGKTSILGMLLIIIIATLGVISFATLGFEQEEYTVLSRENLVFDQNYFKELEIRYDNFKRKKSRLMVTGIFLLTTGFLAFALEEKLNSIVLVPYYPIFVALIAIGLYLVVHILTIISGYELLLKNKEHTNGLVFRLRQKMKKRFNDL